MYIIIVNHSIIILSKKLSKSFSSFFSLRVKKPIESQIGLI